MFFKYLLTHYSLSHILITIQIVSQKFSVSQIKKTSTPELMRAIS